MRTNESKKTKTKLVHSLQDIDHTGISAEGLCFFAEELTKKQYLSPAEVEESVFSLLRQLFEEKVELCLTVIFQAVPDLISADHSERLKAITRGIFRAAVYGSISIIYNANHNKAFGEFINKIFCELESDKREFNGYIKKGVLISAPSDILDVNKRGIDFLCIDLDKMIPHLICNGKTNSAHKIYINGKFDTLCTTLAEYFSDVKQPIRIMSSTASDSFISTLASTLDAEEIITG
jgi:hypothetical protein